MDEATTLARLDAILRTLEETLGGDMPLTKVRAFVQVAANPQASQVEISDILGVPKGNLSRYLIHLGPRDRQGNPGLEVIAQRQNPTNMRFNEYYLTPKGRGLLHRVGNALEGKRG